MESRRPHPVTRSAVHPATPSTVITKFLLYRIRLRAVALWLNLSRDHMTDIRSRNTRFPTFGGRGRMSAAGLSLRALPQAETVAPMVQSKASADERIARFQRNSAISGGRR